MNTHYRCPHCDKQGTEIAAQDGTVLACPYEGCRVYTFATYYG